MKLDVLAFAAHPDDVELNCGGTIASLTSSGKRVGIIDLTLGEMGTRGTVESRKKEAKHASEILGIAVREQLELPDSDIRNTRENQLRLIQVIRTYQPHLCLVGAPHDRHPDHGAATKLMTDSLFYSGLKKLTTTDAQGNEQNVWRPAYILHYMQDRPFEPDLVLDISSHMEQKKKAIEAFNTQFNVKEKAEDHTYISTPEYFEQVIARARYFGHLAGFTYGEPFKYYNGPVPLQDFDLFFNSTTD
ncbi:MAG: bacillithiol biosynthesis deacetylase BshB1 [Bacteroidota bacterium]